MRYSREEKMIQFTGVIQQDRCTSKAILFQSDYMDEPIWVPRSQCEIEPDGDEPGRCILHINEWLVNKNPGWE